MLGKRGVEMVMQVDGVIVFGEGGGVVLSSSVGLV